MNIVARDRIEFAAKELGFVLFGVAPAVTPQGFHRLIDWLACGYGGDMHYFQNRLDAYGNLDRVLDGTRSVIVLGFPYRTIPPPQLASHHGRVARYAWGQADYHDLIHERLKSLTTLITDSHPGERARGVVDSAPVMEREFAQLAGLGWCGKNSLLLNRQQGSYFFLSCVLTTLDLPPTTTEPTDHCGTCTRCLDACPTDAFVSAGVLDSRRCISYQTIENRGEIPRELRDAIGNWLFGCDVCQEVCPWNRFGQTATDDLLWPAESSYPVDLIELLSLDESQFRARFRHTPLWRPRRRGLLRNAAICLGNAQETRAVMPLIALLGDDESIVRGAAVWSLAKINDRRGWVAIADAYTAERDESVRQEMEIALGTL